MSAHILSREKHGEMGPTTNLSTQPVFLFRGISKRLEQDFVAEMTLDDLQSKFWT